MFSRRRAIAAPPRLSPQEPQYAPPGPEAISTLVLDFNFGLFQNTEMNAGNDVFSALSSPVRRRVLGLLRDRAMTAGELAAEVDVAKPTLSGHLNVLKAADLVTVERNGASLIYRINLSVAEDALAALMDLFQLAAPRAAEMVVTPTDKKRSRT